MKIDFSAAFVQIQNMIQNLIRMLPNILLGLLIVVAFFFLARFVNRTVARLTAKRSRIRTAGEAVGRLAQGGVILVGLLVAMSVALPGFSPGDAVGMLGIGSVAIGFAFRDILQNFLAGILLLLTHPFVEGDEIRIGDEEGTVDRIQTRATFLTTDDNRRIVIPNSDLFTNKVIVNTAFDRRRVHMDVGIGYGDDIELAQRLIVEAMKEVNEILDDPAPQALVYELAGSAVTIRARWWISPPRLADALGTRNQILTSIKNKLTEHGIDLPYETRQILFHDQTEETDGDRSRQREGWPAGDREVPKQAGIARSIAERAVVEIEGGKRDLTAETER